MKKAQVRISVGSNGEAITQERLMSLTITDNEGYSADRATIVFDDTDGIIAMPSSNDFVSIAMGWEDEGGPVEIYRGRVDGNPTSSISPENGLTMSVACTSVNPKGRAKERMQKSWKNKTLGNVLSDAASAAGLKVPVIGKEFASKLLPLEVQDGESFLELGQRLADEFGGLFKMSDDLPIFVDRNASLSASGKALPVAVIQAGDNLKKASVKARQTRAAHGSYKARYLDTKTGKAKEVEVKDETSESDTVYTLSRQEMDERLAVDAATAAMKAGKRGKAGGTITAEGSPLFAAGGRIELRGVRAGVDGTYRVKSVAHNYSGSGWVCTLQVDTPGDDTGKDNRKA